MVQEFGPYMAPGGGVISITYMASEKAVPGYGGGMSSAKAQLESDTRTLAFEAGREWGIRVNTISAGPLKSRAASAIGKGLGSEKGHIDFSIDYMKANSPLPGNDLNSDDVGAAALALLAPQLSRAITGVTLYVDNGMHAMGLALDSQSFADSPTFKVYKDKTGAQGKTLNVSGSLDVSLLAQRALDWKQKSHSVTFSREGVAECGVQAHHHTANDDPGVGPGKIDSVVTHKTQVRITQNGDAAAGTALTPLAHTTHVNTAANYVFAHICLFNSNAALRPSSPPCLPAASTPDLEPSVMRVARRMTLQRSVALERVKRWGGESRRTRRRCWEGRGPGWRARAEHATPS
eukprot:3628089-Rhodomonas_salina.1